ncbi:discoidin domain-containing protein [Paenibacillus sp. J5C_2022]|uniref:discoidin domain-containing protein n=1 Tax=Paenibacillus sp. J5C2022 TaxID=2977129 RepID=UPI0021D2B62B|nr:discoidin domain-containing protein [Paenibacillus sp. J5C2022]MCU6707523.1 discoidin domain-containing protein [Paenibacillus sp. J5C2022]
MTRMMKRLFLTGSAVLLLALLIPAIGYAYSVSEIASDGPDTGKGAYALFQEKLGPSPVDGPGSTHIHEDADDVIGNHFVFHIEEGEAMDGCCTDRQRLELKGYGSSPLVTKALPGQTFTYNWYFKVNEEEFTMSPGGAFNHIFQLKMVGGDAGAPVLTYTLSDGKLLFRHSPIGATMDEVEVLAEANWSDVTDKWVYASITVDNTDERNEDGSFKGGAISMSLRNLDGSVIMEWSGERETWREGGEFNRPKWGIYRKVFPDIGPATIRFANFEIINHSVESGESHTVASSGNTHIEAETFSDRNGHFFKQSCPECSGGAYMEVPEGWEDEGVSEYLGYRIDNASSGQTAYVHVYGQAESDTGSRLSASLEADNPDAYHEVALPVDEWGWATAEIELYSGDNMLYLMQEGSGIKLDKIAVSISETPPAVAIVPRLDTLTVNGQPLAGFDPNVHEYVYKLPFQPMLDVPAIGAMSASGDVSVEQPAEWFGEGFITVSNPLEPSLDVTYRIGFTGFPYPESLPEPFDMYDITAVSATAAHGSGPASGSIDRDRNTKWTVGGTEQSITFDLGEVKEVNRVLIAYHNPNAFIFQLDVSEDGETWTRVMADTVAAPDQIQIPQLFSFVDIDARYIRYNALANTNNNWTDVTEFFVGRGPTDPDAELPEQPIDPPKLGAITIDGQPLTDFHADTLEYVYEWPLDTSDVPVVEASGEHAIEVIQSDGLYGTATINVTHKDHADITSTYSIVFRGLALRPGTTVPENTTLYPVQEVTYSSQHGSHPASNAVDGKSMTRWAVSVTNSPHWSVYDLGEVKPVSYILASHMNAHNRNMHFKLELSVDGEQWTTVFDGDSTMLANDPDTIPNEGEGLELFAFKQNEARYVRYTGNGATTDTGDRDNWHNLIEILIGGGTPPQSSGDGKIRTFGIIRDADALAAGGFTANKLRLQGSMFTDDAGQLDGFMTMYDVPSGDYISMDIATSELLKLTEQEAVVQGIAYDKECLIYTVRLTFKPALGGGQVSIRIWEGDVAGGDAMATLDDAALYGLISIELE